MARIKDSILQDVKQMVGQEFDDDTYDTDIMIHTNAVFFTLQQLGVGPENGFNITTEDQLWGAYTTPSRNLDAVKSYIYLRVRLLFDPPTNSFLVTSLQKQIDQLEWRLMVDMDPKLVNVDLEDIDDD